jgi:hypothetical protein
MTIIPSRQSSISNQRRGLQNTISQPTTMDTIVQTENIQELEINDQTDNNNKLLDNIHYGTKISTTISNNILRIYHQNIKGAKIYKKWEKWKDGANWLRNNAVGMATIVETNTKWNEQNIREAVHHAKKDNNKVKLCATSSIEIPKEDYLPGGSACLVLNKWTGRIIEQIKDKSGLGRWAGYRLRGKKNKEIIILSAYRPTKSNNAGDSTCYSQQWRILRETSNNNNPEPRKQFMKDLTTLVQKWEAENCEILIGIDANEGIENNNSSVKRLLENTTLNDLLDLDYNPPTHIRGKNAIDFLLGTPLIKQSIKAAAYLPFFGGAWDSDHRPMIIDIDTNILFGNVENSIETKQRKLKSNNNNQVSTFMRNLKSNKKLNNLYENIKKLYNKHEWNNKDHEIFEKYDKQFTKILVKCEQNNQITSETDWSINLHNAKLIVRYWRIAVK